MSPRSRSPSSPTRTYNTNRSPSSCAQRAIALHPGDVRSGAQRADIARVGDIDHLVATPPRLWVIETQRGRVPPRQLPEVLRRIARNVEAVRAWAPPGTRVSGCLVFENADPPPKPTYPSGPETIEAFADRMALARDAASASRSKCADSRNARGTRVQGHMVGEAEE